MTLEPTSASSTYARKERARRQASGSRARAKRVWDGRRPSARWLAAACRTVLLCLAAKMGGAQSLEVGLIDFYGVRQVSEASLRLALGISQGDEITRAVEDEAKDRLEAVSGVRRAALQAVCCHAGKATLYVGIEESSASPSQRLLRPAPRGEIRLPGEVLDGRRRFLDAMMAAVRRGESGEDRSQGHSLMHDPAARALQERFVGFAATHRERLKSVLAESADTEHRAIAATVLGYATDKATVVEELLHAVSDAEEDVRNAATRALAVIAAYAADHPELGIRIPPDPFIGMLDSLVWSDRNKGTFMLTSLTRGRDPALLARLRTQAFDALVEMALWQDPGHAMGAYVLLGRSSGLSEKEIQETWARGEQRQVIESLVESWELPLSPAPPTASGSAALLGTPRPPHSTARRVRRPSAGPLQLLGRSC